MRCVSRVDDIKCDWVADADLSKFIDQEGIRC